MIPAIKTMSSNCTVTIDGSKSYPNARKPDPISGDEFRHIQITFSEWHFQKSFNGTVLCALQMGRCLPLLCTEASVDPSKSATCKLLNKTDPGGEFINFWSSLALDFQNYWCLSFFLQMLSQTSQNHNHHVSIALVLYNYIHIYEKCIIDAHI